MLVWMWEQPVRGCGKNKGVCECVGVWVWEQPMGDEYVGVFGLGTTNG